MQKQLFRKCLSLEVLLDSIVAIFIVPATAMKQKSVLGNLGNTRKRKANILVLEDWINPWGYNCLRNSIRIYKTPESDDRNYVLQIFLISILYRRRRGILWDIHRKSTDNPVFCIHYKVTHNFFSICSDNQKEMIWFSW